MAKKKGIKGYKISRGYSRVTIWTFGSMTRCLVFTEIVVPNKELSRKERYKAIAEVLKDVFGFAPVYKMTAEERKAADKKRAIT